MGLSGYMPWILYLAPRNGGSGWESLLTVHCCWHLTKRLVYGYDIFANCYCGPFYYHGLTYIPAWISNYIHYMIWEGIINFSPHHTDWVCDHLSLLVLTLINDDKRRLRRTEGSTAKMPIGGITHKNYFSRDTAQWNSTIFSYIVWQWLALSVKCYYIPSNRSRQLFPTNISMFGINSWVHWCQYISSTIA